MGTLGVEGLKDLVVLEVKDTSCYRHYNKSIPHSSCVLVRFSGHVFRFNMASSSSQGVIT